MPYSKVEDHDECDDGGIAVVKDEDGEVMGCHANESDADDQIAALEASEDDDGRSRRVRHEQYAARVQENDEKDTISFTINTDSQDRHGTVLDPEGGNTENFERNPVVLFNHGHGPNGNMPVGRAENVYTRPGSMTAEVRFDSDDEFAAEIERKVRNGFLNAASVGFEPIGDPSMETRDGEEVPVFEEWELVEFSIVPIPSNPDALVEGRGNPFVDDLAKRVADKLEDRLATRLDEDDASSADGDSSNDSERSGTPASDDADAASADQDDDSQADDSRDELKTKMRLAAANGEQVDEDELTERFLRKLGKR